jgi:hypothetical protein
MKVSYLKYFVFVLILSSCNSKETTEQIPEKIVSDSLIQDSALHDLKQARDTLINKEENKIEEPLEINSQNLLGDWAMGDGFIFKEDGTFDYFEPECYEHYEGNWKLKEDQLILVFKKLSCKNERFESHYEVVSLTKHNLTLQDPNGNSVIRFRN